MKTSFLITLLIAINFATVSQTTINEVSGNYEVTYDSTNALIIDKLSLNSDGTFVFHEYDKHDNGVPPERNKYAKGTWKLEKNTITFSTTESDFDEKPTLDLNNTKARFITKSPRDTSDRDVKTSIKFFQSETPWVTGRTLLKIS
ncbi:MAG: hypothetical protein ACSHXF_02245 [Aquaticitalea sp.]